MQGTLGAKGRFTTYYAVQGFSPRRGHFVTLFAPFNTAEDATAKMLALQEQNPQLKYRVNCLRGWQDDNGS